MSRIRYATTDYHPVIKEGTGQIDPHEVFVRGGCEVGVAGSQHSRALAGLAGARDLDPAWGVKGVKGVKGD